MAFSAAQKYNCRVHVSQLLPRKDELAKKAEEINAALESQTLPMASKMIRHGKISKNHLQDDKHLNRYRVGNDKMAGSQLFTAVRQQNNSSTNQDGGESGRPIRSVCIILTNVSCIAIRYTPIFYIRNNAFIWLIPLSYKHMETLTHPSNPC